MPKSVQWWRTNLSSSSKLPSSSNKLIRSRAVNLPALCSRSRRSGPPPASASSLRRRNSAMRCCCEFISAGIDFFSGKRGSWRRRLLYVEDADRKVSGKPNCAEEQHDSQNQFRDDGDGSLQRRNDGSDFQCGVNQHKHRGQGHGDDKNGGQDGSEKLFHRNYASDQIAAL